MKEILVAMSGGVDSSVAAAILQRQGHRITGAYMKNWINEPGIVGDCPWQQDIEDARAVAEKLGIPFRVVNLMAEYKARVVEYLLEGYRSGITPNPDVMCNREIKFGAFLQWGLDHGYDAVATGHYARLRRNENGTSDILEGADKNKDQSYFLALLRQDQAARALFPVGDLLKPAVREIASELGLATAEKKDSQGICFIGEVKMSDFLKAYLPEEPGEIVDPAGKVLGRHRGLHFYTLGQRRGVGVSSPHYGQKYVVVEKRPHENRLVMALDEPGIRPLYASEAIVSALSFTNQPILESRDLLAKPRYRAAAVPVRLGLLGEGRAHIEFSDPQRALTPGQICALYDGETLLGGGVFEEILASRPD